MKDPHTRKALRVGCALLAISLPLGVALEALHGFKVAPWLESPVRREMWRLAHAHGSMLGILCLLFAALAASFVASETTRAKAARELCWGAVLMPLGFFAGGVLNYEGDPSLGVALVPVGALLLIVALVRVLRAA
jgi:hypothetical protein